VIALIFVLCAHDLTLEILPFQMNCMSYVLKFVRLVQWNARNMQIIMKAAKYVQKRVESAPRFVPT
jgi:hypothetical protein